MAKPTDKGNPQDNKPPTGTPSQAEFGLMTAWMAQNGYGIGQVLQAVGARPNGRTRQEITNDLIEWLIDNQ